MNSLSRGEGRAWWGGGVGLVSSIIRNLIIYIFPIKYLAKKGQKRFNFFLKCVCTLQKNDFVINILLFLQVGHSHYILRNGTWT